MLFTTIRLNNPQKIRRGKKLTTPKEKQTKVSSLNKLMVILRNKPEKQQRQSYDLIDASRPTGGSMYLTRIGSYNLPVLKIATLLTKRFPQTERSLNLSRDYDQTSHTEISVK